MNWSQTLCRIKNRLSIKPNYFLKLTYKNNYLYTSVIHLVYFEVIECNDNVYLKFVIQQNSLHYDRYDNFNTVDDINQNALDDWSNAIIKLIIIITIMLWDKYIHKHNILFTIYTICIYKLYTQKNKIHSHKIHGRCGRAKGTVQNVNWVYVKWNEKKSIPTLGLA